MPTEELQDWLDTIEESDVSQNDESLSDLWSPEQGSESSQTRDLGELLLERGAIDALLLDNARKLVEKTPGAVLANVLLEMNVAESAIQSAVADLANMLFEAVDPQTIDYRRLKQLGYETCKEAGIMPLRMQGKRLILGMVRPDNLLIIDEVRHKMSVAVKPVVICRRDIAAVFDSFKYEEEEKTPADTDFDVDAIIAGIDEDDVEVVETKEQELDLEKMAGESPVIRYVNYLIFNAVKEGASDIHVEPQEKGLQVRYRIDGIMFKAMHPPHQMHAAIISRMKIMANLDISERRLPQDGRIRARVHGRKLDLRISTVPTAAGEKAVLRILDTRAIQVPLEQLGMHEDVLHMWQRQIAQPHGILLVTGPTGSGKTTTLYASLNQMDLAKLNISTVEDPVEYHLDGINQIQTHESIGMTFAAALRALLRQDPDVIMLGEIRDSDTARIAIQASLTGHLVLSTLHTNDAPASITRLINIGVEPYLIGSAINASIAQRLVRRVCDNCKEPARPDETMSERLRMYDVASDQVWQGRGCDKCRNTGYAGRVGLYEMLVLDDTLRDRIASNPSVTEFRRVCIERGMVTLRQDGFNKVTTGLTTVDEVLRVTEGTI